MRWYCYACGRTQPRIEVQCHCEWWREKAPWIRSMLDKLIYDISPHPFPFMVKGVGMGVEIGRQD